ncbi:MAG TPA: response regulator [Stellaceae bacterium]|nr:response regulator [Stellaceae bacterium]
MATSPISILVVEDDPDVGILLEHVLASAGYRVDRASTAAESRGLIASNRYDLVLADGVLPDGTGVELADQAKARGMKALIITGYALQLSQLGVLDRHDYVLKPIRPEALIGIVAGFVGWPQREQRRN